MRSHAPRGLGAALLAGLALVRVNDASAAPDLASCGAQGLRGYIGAPVEDMQRVRAGDARYVCAGCAMTMEFNSGRLTVVYDRKTGRVTRLGCN